MTESEIPDDRAPESGSPDGANDEAPDVPLVPAPALAPDKSNTPPKSPKRFDRRELEALADSDAVRVTAVGVAALEAYDSGLRSTTGLTQWAEKQLTEDQVRLIKGLYSTTQAWLEDVFKRYRQADLSWQERERKITALGIELKTSFRGQLIERARGTTGPPALTYDHSAVLQ